LFDDFSVAAWSILINKKKIFPEPKPLILPIVWKTL
jgi:hypothetical protein